MKTMYLIRCKESYARVLKLLKKKGYKLNAERYKGEIEYFDNLVLFVDYIKKNYCVCIFQNDNVSANDIDLCVDVEQYEEDIRILQEYGNEWIFKEFCSNIYNLDEWNEDSLEQLKIKIKTDRKLLNDIYQRQAKGILKAIKEAFKIWEQHNDLEDFFVRDYNYNVCWDGIK